MWVYREIKENLYTVGFYTPDGDWIAVSDHTEDVDAIERVHYLNGGMAPSHDLMLNGCIQTESFRT